MKFDISGDGKLQLEDLHEAAEVVKAASGNKTSYPFAAFPKSIHHILETFDTDGDRCGEII